MDNRCSKLDWCKIGERKELGFQLNKATCVGPCIVTCGCSEINPLHNKQSNKKITLATWKHYNVVCPCFPFYYCFSLSFLHVCWFVCCTLWPFAQQSIWSKTYPLRQFSKEFTVSSGTAVLFRINFFTEGSDSFGCSPSNGVKSAILCGKKFSLRFRNSSFWSWRIIWKT